MFQFRLGDRKCFQMYNTTTWTTRPFWFLTPIKTFDVGQEIDVWHPPAHRARPHKNIILDRAWSNLISHTPTCHLSLKHPKLPSHHWCSSPVCYYRDLWSGTQRCSQAGQGINYPIAEWGVKTRVWNLILHTNNTTWIYLQLSRHGSSPSHCPKKGIWADIKITWACPNFR